MYFSFIACRRAIAATPAGSTDGRGAVDVVGGSGGGGGGGGAIPGADTIGDHSLGVRRPSSAPWARRRGSRAAAEALAEDASFSPGLSFSLTDTAVTDRVCRLLGDASDGGMATGARLAPPPPRRRVVTWEPACSPRPPSGDRKVSIRSPCILAAHEVATFGEPLNSMPEPPSAQRNHRHLNTSPPNPTRPF